MTLTEKKKKRKSILFRKISNNELDFAKKFLEIKNSLILPPQKVEDISKEIMISLTKEGFVVGDLTEKDFKSWIKNNLNTIIAALGDNGKKESLLGYSITLDTPEIHEEVIGYSKHIKFEKQKYQTTILKKKFSYLIQIAVKKEESNQGIGSDLLRHTFSETDKAIVSFVVKNPIKNEPSLYIHLKNGFDYMGEYTGPYSDFKDYRSIGLIYYPNNSKKSKKEVLELMKNIYSS